MSRRFTVFTVALTAVVAFLVGAIFAGGVSRSAISAGPKAAPARSAVHAAALGAGATLVSFADVVEHINPAVVNIDATARGRDVRRRRSRTPPEPFDGPDQPFD